MPDGPGTQTPNELSFKTSLKFLEKYLEFLVELIEENKKKYPGCHCHRLIIQFTT